LGITIVASRSLSITVLWNVVASRSVWWLRSLRSLTGVTLWLRLTRIRLWLALCGSISVIQVSGLLRALRLHRSRVRVLRGALRGLRVVRILSVDWTARTWRIDVVRHKVYVAFHRFSSGSIGKNCLNDLFKNGFQVGHQFLS
jgi:hypothetical protein